MNPIEKQREILRAAERVRRAIEKLCEADPALTHVQAHQKLALERPELWREGKDSGPAIKRALAGLRERQGAAVVHAIEEPDDNDPRELFVVYGSNGEVTDLLLE